jgi:hypothetical protein
MRRFILSAVLVVFGTSTAHATLVSYAFQGTVVNASGGYSGLSLLPVVGGFIYDSSWPILGQAYADQAEYIPTNDLYGILVAVDGLVFNSRTYWGADQHFMNIQNNRTFGPPPNNDLLVDQFSYSTDFSTTRPGLSISLIDIATLPAIPDALDSLSLNQELVLNRFVSARGSVFNETVCEPACETARFDFSIDRLARITPVPEPDGVRLFLVGLAGLWVMRRRSAAIGRGANAPLGSRLASQT